MRVRPTLFALLIAVTSSFNTSAENVESEYSTPIISIILDDMGNREATDRRAVTLPGAVACAFLPHAPYTHRMAVMAHSYNKEVMLHAPMQASGNNVLGPGGLTVDMPQEKFLQTLREDIASVPHVRGISNHMGSLLTQHPDHMVWLMHELTRHGDMFFVDSRTTSKSVAGEIAGNLGIPNIGRDVFLDNKTNIDYIRMQFNELIRKARIRGSALAVGHTYPATLDFLEKELPRLEQYGVKLVPLSAMIEYRKRRASSWQASLFPSPRDVKN